MSEHIFVIAEAGVNHNGDEELAFKLVDAAVQAGADAVKFQTFKTEKLVTRAAAKARYQRCSTDAEESQFSMLKKLELTQEVHYELIAYCHDKGIAFLTTAFDLDSLMFLVDDLGLRTLKIPSGEITNGPFLLEHAQTGCDLIVSTGMATLGEVEEALSVIAYGFTGGAPPSKAAFQAAYCSQAGREALKNKVTLLHCTSEYPAPLQDINLNAIHTLRTAFGLKVGYSDHSDGIIVPTAAAALGVTVVEKHFTLDKSLPGPDHKASLEPDELKAMVEAIRTVEQIMGDGIKGPFASERANREIARKSLVSTADIAQGEVFTQRNITAKRPGTGRSPMDYWELLGSFAQTKIPADQIIK